MPGRRRTGAGGEIRCSNSSTKPRETHGLGEAAARLASLGFPVFRLRERDKRPLCPGWQEGAATDPGAVRRLWRKDPRANIGLARGSSCWVLDVDGDEGQVTLGELELRHGALPITPVSITGSNGLHMLFAPTVRVSNSVRRLGPGLDTRAARGYIVAPPSIHPNGHHYRWASGREPWAVPLAPAPAWVVDLLDPPPLPRPGPRPIRVGTAGTAYVVAAVSRELEAVATAREGTRNDMLFTAALKLGRFVRDGQLDARDIGPILVGAALGTGLDRQEAERTIASGLSTAIRGACDGSPALRGHRARGRREGPAPGEWS